jgi:murein DD-endopeptidase MepM/ murein hydrolase activator NlpD
MESWRTSTEGEIIKLKINGQLTEFLFLPDKKFHQIERAFFLNVLFRFPLQKGRISSNYGFRKSPITGRQHFHQGIDIAAPSGSEVIVAREGIVENLGYNKILGNFIVVKHEGGYTTIYGHLKKYFVELNQKLTFGMIIGQVGSTGYSTGPHLHFEIRKSGQSKNPMHLIPGKKK